MSSGFSSSPVPKIFPLENSPETGQCGFSESAVPWGGLLCKHPPFRGTGHLLRDPVLFVVGTLPLHSALPCLASLSQSTLPQLAGGALSYLPCPCLCRLPFAPIFP